MAKFQFECATLKTNCSYISANRTIVNLQMLINDHSRMKRFIEDLVELVVFISEYIELTDDELSDILV